MPDIKTFSSLTDQHTQTIASRLRTIGVSALVIACFIGFYFGTFILSWVVLPIARWRGRGQLERARPSQHAVRVGFRLLHSAIRRLGLLNGDASVSPIRLPDAPCILIANHPTLIDVTAILANLPNVACVVKPALFRSPTLGRVLRDAWYIVGGTGTPGDGASVMREAEARIAGGLSVLVFPEGTRSPPGGLGTFRRGAFEIACRADVPVVPLLLLADPPFLHKESAWYALPASRVCLTLAQLPSLDPAQWNRDSRAMAAACEQQYRNALGARKRVKADERDCGVVQSEAA